MKRFLKVAYLPFAVLVCALATCALRLWLFGLGKDDRGLLATGSFPDAMSWVLVAVTMLLLVIGTRQLQRKGKYSVHFPPSLLAAIGMVLAAWGFATTSIMDLMAGADSIDTVSIVLGFLAAAAIFLLAYGRLRGQRLSVLFHGVICLYLMFLLVSHYRHWSACPQLQSYAFELLAIVFVMLAGYQRAAFDAGRGDPRTYTFFSLAALYFCIAALPGSDNLIFFLGCAVWMLVTPCRLTPSSQEED